MLYFNPKNSILPSEIKKQDSPEVTGPWTATEHKRFLVAVDMFPQGPWKAIAKYVGSRTARQTQTHAQKYREKLMREMRGLKKGGKNKPTRNTTNINEMVQQDLFMLENDIVKCEESSFCPLKAVLAMDDMTLLTVPAPALLYKDLCEIMELL